MLEVEGLRHRRERVEEEAAEEGPELAGAGHRPEHDFLARAVDEIGGQRGPEVRRDQELLELLEQCVVDGPIGVQDGAETAGQVLLRPTESVAETLTQAREKLHGLSEGRTKRVMTEPLAPSRGMGRPLSSRLTPPALPIVMTNGPFEIHSRISLAGIVSSLVRPSSVRTRIHVVSVVRAMSRYGSPSPRADVAAAMDADEAAGDALATLAAGAALGVVAAFGRATALGAAAGCWTAGALVAAGADGAAGAAAGTAGAGATLGAGALGTALGGFVGCIAGGVGAAA